MDGLSIKTLQELGQDSHQNISVAGYKGAWVGSQVSGFFFFLEGLVLYFKKTFINFQYQNSYIIGFFSSQLVPKETTPKERTF